MTEKKVLCLYVIAGLPAITLLLSELIDSDSIVSLLFGSGIVVLITVLVIFLATILPVMLSLSTFSHRDKFGYGISLALLLIALLFYWDAETTTSALGGAFSGAFATGVGFLTVLFVLLYTIGKYISKIHIGILLVLLTLESAFAIVLFLPFLFM